MEVGSILDYNREIARKKEWQPDAKTKAYLEAHVREYQYDQQQFLKQYKVFNDRNFLDYQILAEEDFYKYTPKPRDPADWRNFIRSGDERNRLDLQISFLGGLNFGIESVAKDWLGAVSEDMSLFSESFIKYLNILDDSDTKDLWTDTAMFSLGTVFKQVKYVNRKTLDKVAGDWKPKDGLQYAYTTRLVDAFEGVESTVLKPNRVFLSDVGQADTSKQEHVWYEMVVPYGNAYQMFCEYDQWQYVKPYNAQYDQWTDTPEDVEIEDKGIGDKVRVRFRESTLSNELSIYCNKVLMTPIGLKLPEGDYSIFYQQASLLHPTGSFAYGRSFMDNVRPVIGVKDVLTSILVDTARQNLEPPLKSRFRTMVNRYMFAPSAVTPMQGDGDLSPLIPPNAMQNFVFEALKVYEEMQEKSSPSPFLNRPQGGPEKTKRQIELEMQEAIRAAFGMVGAAIAWRKKEAAMKLRIGLKHFSKITGFQFEVPGSEGITSNHVSFQAIPKPSEKKARGQMIKKLAEAENLAKSRGKRARHLIVDPEAAHDYSFIVDFRVNPHQRDSETADVQDVKEKIQIYQGLQMDPQKLQKLAVKAFHDDEEELTQKPQAAQPGMMPAQPQLNPQPQPMA